jgi:hypothetical protein
LQGFYLDKQLGFYTSSTDLQGVVHLSVYQERNELQTEAKDEESKADPPENDGTIARMEYFVFRLHFNAQYGRKIRPSHPISRYNKSLLINFWSDKEWRKTCYQE